MARALLSGLNAGLFTGLQKVFPGVDAQSSAVRASGREGLAWLPLWGLLGAPGTPLTLTRRGPTRLRSGRPGFVPSAPEPARACRTEGGGRGGLRPLVSLALSLSCQVRQRVLWPAACPRQHGKSECVPRFGGPGRGVGARVGSMPQGPRSDHQVEVVHGRAQWFSAGRPADSRHVVPLAGGTRQELLACGGRGPGVWASAVWVHLEPWPFWWGGTPTSAYVALSLAGPSAPGSDAALPGPSQGGRSQVSSRCRACPVPGPCAADRSWG